MKKRAIFTAVLLAAGALWAAAPSVTINSVRQRYPWNNKIDVVYTLELDKTHAYGLKFKVWNGDNAVTNTVATDLDITPAQKLTSYVGTNTIDLTGLAGFNEVLAKTGPKIKGVLIDKGEREVPPDPNVLDEGDGVTFVPGDYLVLDLTDGAITTNKNVQTADAFQDNVYKTTKMVFRKVPVGSFHMNAHVTDSYPWYTGGVVRITKEYYIGVYECTVAQYDNLINGNTSSTTKTAKNYASWNDAAETYVGKFSTLAKFPQSGYAVSLPNQAQWERAARAGTKTEWFFGSSFDSGLEITAYAWFWSNCNGIKNVGTKAPNAWGLYDMYGNVAEWCSDWYGPLNYSEQPGGPATGTERILLGGNYYSYNPPECSSIAVVVSTVPSNRSAYDGFRLVLNPVGE